MKVKIRFKAGPVVSRRNGKNSRIARVAANALTLPAIGFFVLALWRLGMDLGLTANFIFTSGIWSHWQIWFAGAAAAQYCCWRLTSYVRKAEEVRLAPPSVPSPGDRIHSRSSSTVKPRAAKASAAGM